MEYKFIKAKAIENIHAGKASASTDSIDKPIQRDSSGIPCVENTSFKGAIKQHFNHKSSTKVFVDAAFGAEGENGTPISVGQYSIKQLNLLSIPIIIHPVPEKMNSTVLVTSWEILDTLFEDICLYNPEDTKTKQFRNEYPEFRKSYVSGTAPVVFSPESSEITIPTLTCIGKNYTLIQEGNTKTLPIWLENVIFNEYDQNKVLIIVNSNTFRKLTNDFELPLKHRNIIEWGESKNLWIEQFLPRGTRFISKVKMPEKLYRKKDNSEISKHKESFSSEVDKVCIQIGANKSVGYGECYFEIL